MKVIAIIPARAGSKGVPGKNINKIAGKPLISYTIIAAINSKLLQKIIVSSNDPKVQELVREHRQVNFHNRSSDIAGDNSPITETIHSVLKQYDIENKYDAVMLLQPTSPIRTSEQIDKAINLFAENPEANSLISVCAMDDVHPARMYWQKDNILEPILSEFEEFRRQEIPKAYYRNGAIYIIRTNAFRKENSVMVKPSIGFEMPSSHLLNIDEPRDILIAEVLIKAWKDGRI
jgi:CMP-N,N'-diacetyllegionaminic acid synthase